MVKMVTQTEAQNFEISELENLLEKPSNLPEVTGICHPSKSRPRHRLSFQLGSKLKYLNSDQLLPS